MASSPDKAGPRIAVVGTAGGWSSERLLDAVAARGGPRALIAMDTLAVDLTRGTLSDGQHDVRDFDALIVKKIDRSYSPHNIDRLELLSYAESLGVRVFSRPQRILRLINRLSCTVALRAAGIPMPETVISEDPHAALSALERFGEAIAKPLYSTKARGMVLLAADDPHALRRLSEFAERNGTIYLQRRMHPLKRDLGLVFLGGRYIGAYAREAAAGSWTTTTEYGGKYAACDPGAEIVALAEKAQAPFALDFTCVDVVETGDGPVVLEVSAFGGFRGLLETTGQDAAAMLVDHVIAELAAGPGHGG